MLLEEGKDISDLGIDERAKLGIGFAFQQPVKFKGITVYDLIKLSSGKDINKKEACEILSNALVASSNITILEQRIYQEQQMSNNCSHQTTNCMCNNCL